MVQSPSQHDGVEYLADHIDHPLDRSALDQAAVTEIKPLVNIAKGPTPN